MDIADFKRRFDAAREYTFEHESAPGIALQLRIPLLDELRLAVKATGGKKLEDAQPQVMRLQVIGWSGIKPSDVLPDVLGVDDTLPFDRELAALVFDRWPDLYDQAYVDLLMRYGARRTSAEADAKNSARKSPGKEPTRARRSRATQ